MWNDDAQLEEELNWKPRKRESILRAPRGASAIIVMGFFLSLPMWGVTMFVVRSARDLGVLLLVLVLLLEGAIGMAIGQRLWRGMGPVLRGIIRPFMLLGPIPPLLVVGCFAFSALGYVAQFVPKARSEGKNWAQPWLRDPVMKLRTDELCTKLGPQWRVPREDEVAKLDPLPPEGESSTRYWLERAPDADPMKDVVLRVHCALGQCKPEVLREEPTQGTPRGGTRLNLADVVCVNF